MKIVFLDAATIGDDLIYESFEELGEVIVYPTTDEKEFEDQKLVQKLEKN